jgi:hypothetical protein
MASREKKASAPSLFKNKSNNKGIAASLVQHSEDWQMEVAKRFMSVENKKEELLDPYTIQQQLQQANLKRASAWKVAEDADDANTVLAEVEAFTDICRSLKKQLKMTQEFIKDARAVKWFAKKGYERHQEDDPRKACHYLNLLKHANTVDATAKVYEDKFADAETYAKEQAAASEKQVAQEQAALEEEVDEAASDESESENGDKVHESGHGEKWQMSRTQQGSRWLMRKPKSSVKPWEQPTHRGLLQMQHSSQQLSNVINGRRGKGFWQLTGFIMARRMQDMHSTTSIGNSCKLMEHITTLCNAFKQPHYSTRSR